MGAPPPPPVNHARIRDAGFNDCRLCPAYMSGDGRAMANSKNPQGNRVESSYDGRFHAFWRGRVVTEKGRIKRFESEREAREFLELCDALGKVATH